jgi:hypothetical protein
MARWAGYRLSTMLDASQEAKRDVFVLDGSFGLVGRLDGVHIDPEGAAWGTVHCGTFGARTRLVPLKGAHWWSGYLRIPCSRQQVRTAPESRGTVLLNESDVDVLRGHYDEATEEEPRFFRPGQ